MLSVVLVKGPSQSPGAQGRTDRNSNTSDGASASLRGFRVTGHAGFAEYGKDIVCAGVSSITQTALLGLQDTLGLKKVHYRMSPGYLEVLLEPDDAEDPGPRAILRSLELGLLAISRAYKDLVSLEYQDF